VEDRVKKNRLRVGTLSQDEEAAANPPRDGLTRAVLEAKGQRGERGMARGGERLMLVSREVIMIWRLEGGFSLQIPRMTLDLFDGDY